MSSFLLLQNIIYPVNELSLTMISLQDWSLIYIAGLDSKKYLQNQFTVDMNTLKKIEHTLCAHCNIDGKVWSTMRLFHYQEGYAYIQRKSVSDIQITELKKYSVFSKITINKLNDIYLIGLAGLNAKLFLSNVFKKIPSQSCPVIYEKNQTILWFSEPSERFLLVLTKSYFLFLKNNIKQNIFFNNSMQWLLLDIEAGFPIIDKKCSKKFTPQAINLDKLNGISFKKGCYYGQEIIARIFFKNLNKSFLSCLTTQENIYPAIGSLINVLVENKWCKIGVLLSIAHVRCRETWIQVVLYRSVTISDVFKITGFKNIFLIQN